MKKCIKGKVALFIGSDITSQVITNKVVKELLEFTGGVVIFESKDGTNSKKREPEIEELKIYERTLLQSVVYPYQRNKHIQARYQAPDLIARRYPGRVHSYLVKKINSESTLEILKLHNATCGISIRCYQKFGVPIIQYFVENKEREQSCFMNLHPGLLPQYRGVITFLRSMQHSESMAGFSLHHVNTEWDAGDVVGTVAMPLDYTESVLWNMLSQAGRAKTLLVSFLRDYQSGRSIQIHPQDPDKAGYFSFPTREELDTLGSRGISLVQRRRMVNFLVNQFANSDLERAQLRAAISEREAELLV